MITTSWLGRLPIRNRIIAICLFTSAVALLLTAALIVASGYTRDRQNIVRTSYILSNLVGYNAGTALAFKDSTAAEDSLSMLAALPDIIEATILSNDGDVFGIYRSNDPRHEELLILDPAHYRALAASATSKPGLVGRSSTFNDSYLDFAKPIIFDETQQGFFAVRVDLSGLIKNSIISMIAVLFSLFLSLFPVYFLSRRLQRSVTGPIIELANACQEVSSSRDYSKRVHTETDDEIGELAISFNSMLQAVQNRDSELENLVTELKAATAAKSAFLANMSHEIRTPLNGILGITSLLARSPATEKKQAYFKTIDDSANTLLQIINDILDLSRIEAGRFDPEYLQFDLSEIAIHINSIFEPTANKKGLSLAVNLAAGTPTLLKGDSRRLTQVLINLVGNALKFTDHGSVKVDICAEAVSDSETTIYFEVSDTGIGIPPESQDLIFKDFSQVDESITRRFGGTGLGLSVSRKIVELLRGEIGLNSKEGKGSRFWIKVPFERQLEEIKQSGVDSPAAIESIENVDETISTEPRTQYQGQVLIADDSGVNQFIIIETLKTYGINCTAVDSGRAAIEAIKTNSFDLIIMDIQMPDIGGIEAAKMIRQWETNNSANNTTPIIAFSASAMSGDRESFLEAGMDDYLSKPMVIESLERVLKTWLRDCQVTL